MPGSSGSRLFTSERPSASRYSSSGANACSSWRLRDAFENRNVGVEMDFEPHGENLGRGWTHSTSKISRSWRPAFCPTYAGGSLVNLVASLVAGARRASRCTRRSRMLEPRELVPRAQYRAAHRRRPGRQLPDASAARAASWRAGGEARSPRCFPRPPHRRSPPRTPAARRSSTASPAGTRISARRAAWQRALPFRSARRHAAAARKRLHVPSRSRSRRSRSSRACRRARSSCPTAEIIDSDYNLRHCAAPSAARTTAWTSFVAEVEAAVKSGPERKFVYAYWPAYDATSHRYGSESARGRARARAHRRRVRRAARRLSGTRNGR